MKNLGIIIFCFYYFFNIGVSQAQAVKQNIKLVIFDKKTNTKKTINGKINIGDLSGGPARASVSTRRGKILCSGTGSGSRSGASMTGKCLGIPAVAKFSFRNNWSLLVGVWKYKGSWIKFETPISISEED